jgi:HEAT repeat protein
MIARILCSGASFLRAIGSRTGGEKPGAIALSSLSLLFLVVPAVATAEPISLHRAEASATKLSQDLPSPGLQSLPSPAPFRNIDDAFEQLRTADEETREDILNELRDKGTKILPELLRALQDNDPLVKSAAAELLGNLGSDSAPAIPQLVTMLEDQRLWRVPNPRRPFLFSYRPSALSQPPPPPENPNRQLKITAAAALGQIGGPARLAATPPLQRLLQDPDPWVRLNAAWALMQIGADEPVLPIYVTLLQDSNPEVQQATSVVLGQSDTLIGKILGAESTPETTRLLVTALNHPQANIRQNLRDALFAVGSPAIAPLTQALSDPNPLVRLEAAKTLAQFKQQALSALPLLTQQLTDSGQYRESPLPESTFRSTALGSVPLLSVPTWNAWPKPTNPEFWVSAEAALAIGEIAGIPLPAETQTALFTALNSPLPRMRVSATWAILTLDSVSSLALDGEQRQQLVKVLAEVSQPILSNSSGLKNFRLYGTPEYAALQLLEAMGPPASAHLIPFYFRRLEAPDQNDQVAAILGFRNLGSGALPAVPLLRDRYLAGDNQVLRGYTATVLGEIALAIQQDHRQGTLSEPVRQVAVREFEKVLVMMQAPQRQFNQEPIERVAQSLAEIR